MTILHVLSQFEVTGAETFAATLADTQIAAGHTVYIISDNFYTATKASVIAAPIGKRDLAQRISNVRFLRTFIREKQVDLVHAHSRAASWVSYVATRKGKVPLVSSIHGRQHLHFSSRMFSVYGEKRVAVCKSIYDHLNHDLKYSLDTLALVHNGIDLSKWEFRKHSPPKREKKIVSFVGRLSGFKGDTLLVIVEKIFPEIYRRYPNVEFHIIGGMSEKSKILPAIAETNQKVGTELIIAKGFSNDVESVYRSSDLIVGSGRVAMEALACGSPVVAIGESNDVGILSEETKQEALVTNFGDLDARRPINVERSVAAIVQVLERPDSFSAEWGRRFIEEQFEISAVAAQLNLVYAEAIAKKRGIDEIPVLAYERVVDDETYRREIAINPIDAERTGLRYRLRTVAATFTGATITPAAEGKEKVISRDALQRQFQFFRDHSFTPLTFAALGEIADCRRPMPDKPVIITFDAYGDNFRNVLPLMEQFGYTGVFFLQTNFMLNGGADPLTFEQARKIADAGHEIGSASYSRPKMNLISDSELKREVAASKEEIERAIRQTVLSFAYPHGFVNEKIRNLAAAAGYRFGVAMDDGRRNIWANLLKIRRIQIFGGATMFSFWKKTSGKYLWYKYVY